MFRLACVFHAKRLVRLSLRQRRTLTTSIKPKSKSHYLLCCSILSKRRFTKTLFERMIEIAPERQERAKQIVSETGNMELCNVTVSKAVGGMRGVMGLICETSLLDPESGIRFRGLTIPEIQQKLPSAKCRGLPGNYPLPEGMLWLLLTGEIPSEAEVAQLSEELTSEPYNILPKNARNIIDLLPVHQHPMSQFITAISVLQTESKFAQAYHEGVNRSKYWKYTLDDTLRLIAKLPHITSRIYRQTFCDGFVKQPDESLDWSANWCHMINHKDDDNSFKELMRMYFTIHTDHEGGNVSAHATHLVGSALTDPYLSYVAGMCGLSGPLHGLANQESLRFIKRINRLLGDREPTEEFIHKFVVDLLESGQIVPGFGHAVLRVTDPRYTIQREFALEHIPNRVFFKIVDLLYKVAPGILKEWKGGKIANPWPNLDAHSGCLLHEYGLKEDSFYTVLFGMSRAIGVCSNLVIDRMLNAPIERPKSTTLDAIYQQYQNSKK